MSIEKDAEDFLIKFHQNEDYCKVNLDVPLVSSYFTDKFIIPRIRNYSSVFSNHYMTHHVYDGPYGNFPTAPIPNMSKETIANTINEWFDTSIEPIHYKSVSNNFVNDLKKTKIYKALFSGKSGLKLHGLIDGMFSHLVGYKEMKASAVEVIKLDYEYVILSVVAYISEVIWIYFQDEGKVCTLEHDAIEALEKRILKIDELMLLLEVPIYKGYRVDFPDSFPVVLENIRNKMQESKKILTYEAKHIEGAHQALRLLVLRATYGLLHGRVTFEGVSRGAEFAYLIVDKMGLQGVEKSTMKRWIRQHIGSHDNDNQKTESVINSYKYDEIFSGHDLKNMGLVKAEKYKDKYPEINERPILVRLAVLHDRHPYSEDEDGNEVFPDILPGD